MLASEAIGRIEQYLTSHPVSDDPKECRRAWAVASYKLTHDPDYYESYINHIDWYDFDKSFVPGVADEEDYFPELEETPEKQVSFPWLFADELFALLQ